MTAGQNSHLQMFAAVKATCDAYTSTWTPFAGFATAYAAFVSLMPDTATALALQSTSSTATTGIKKGLRTTLEGMLLQLSGALVYSGTINNDPQLAGDARTTPSDLKQMRDDSLVGFADKLLSLKTLTVTELTSMGLSSDFYAEMTDAKAAFTTAIGTPRHMRGKSVRGTQDLAAIIASLNEILTRRMDPAAAVLNNTAPEFYSEYVTARKLVDPSYHTRALNVNVTSSGGGEPLAGVVAMITPGNIEKKTSAGGGFHLGTLAGGTYSMVLSIPGYQTKVVPVNIVDGQATTLEETMVPEA